LDAYLAMLEEAKRRDHRRLGKDLDLFYNHAYSPGGVFWTPRGWTLYQTLVEQWRESHTRAGYVEICNPVLYDRALFDESGHWAHYEENMFIMEAHNRTWCLKPMNCPDTMLFFRSKKRSYRELPLRVSEGGILHRNEVPGSLSGLTRVRQFCQDDAHLFVTEDQIQQEILSILRLVDQTYTLFGIKYDLYLSTRPETFLGEIAQW
ncbi:MAG: threonine--tRNA ligase, partial [Cyanobacteria bacterium HKST-UBA06]|nr:threonine--tRNA ligase [Cyanobacteria bacterium HKST-UBA06]